ncbi:MAG TPA: acyl-CoA dehydrogenase family protein [Blastocatellia bacterium]|nr:acyl-CoA dehydrogenase family protein [Blastocatellia bacterium]
MNFETDAADKEFRADLRAFLGSRLQELFGGDVSDRILDPECRRRWTRALDERGYLVPHWPREWGGGDWPVTWPRIMEQEMSAVKAPLVDTIGIGFVGPMLCKFGSTRQQRHYLPRIRNADDSWCQGFSEPGAGSDVMSLSTTATRHKDGFTVTGRKLWITGAHYANMMFTLVRVQLPDGRREGGLTFLLINIHDPQVKISPVILIDGTHTVNEVTLEGVHVPLEDMVGEQGKGWVYARSLLADERAIVAGLGQIRVLLDKLREILASEYRRGRPLLDDPAYRIQFAKMLVEFNALEFLEIRRLHDKSNSSSSPILTPILKLRGSELRQRVMELIIQALGERALEAPPHSAGNPRSPIPPLYGSNLTQRFFYERAVTILGGSSEIQRNIIAAIGLGL